VALALAFRRAGDDAEAVLAAARRGLEPVPAAAGGEKAP
jgi:hypothetical protein